jgi:hypothetical protein
LNFLIFVLIEPEGGFEAEGVVFDGRDDGLGYGFEDGSFCELGGVHMTPNVS